MNEIEKLRKVVKELKEPFPLNGAQQRQKYTRANSVSRERSKLYDNTSLEELLDEWPCQQLFGGVGEALYSNADGMCKHDECHPRNDDKKIYRGKKCIKKILMIY